MASRHHAPERPGRNPLRLVFEGTREFEGYHGCRSHCWLRLFAAPGRPALAIATEVDSNPGTSITNRCEYLATFVHCLARVEHGAHDAGFFWIEHYPGAPGDALEYFRQDRYSLVTFEWDRASARFCRPHWEPITRADVEALVGGPIGAVPCTAPAPPLDGRIGRLYQPSAN